MGTTDAKQVLDVRQLAPAQRHVRIFETFERLVPDAAFVLVNDHDPKPLYYQFQAELTGRFSWDYLEQGPEVWRVRIGRKQAVTLLTQPLRDEHKELLPHIEEILATADLVGAAPRAALGAEMDKVLEFLTHHLVPHAQAEDRVLYPVVAKAIGAAAAMVAMQFEHVEIGHMIERLAAQRAQLPLAGLDAAQANALRETLYGLYTLVKLHFRKEEELYLPILDARLTPETARQMFVAMEAAAGEAKQQLAVPAV